MTATTPLHQYFVVADSLSVHKSVRIINAWRRCPHAFTASHPHAEALGWDLACIERLHQMGYTADEAAAASYRAFHLIETVMSGDLVDHGEADGISISAIVAAAWTPCHAQAGFDVDELARNADGCGGEWYEPGILSIGRMQ